MNNSSFDLLIDDAWQIKFSFPELLGWMSSCGIVAFIAIVGNSLVIAAFIRAVNLHSRLNYFVVGLAAADILVGVTSIPMWNYILYLTWRGLGISVLVTRLYEALDVFAAVNSILHLMAVSAERLYATLRPYSWNNRMYSKKIYFCGLVMIWTLSAIIAAMFAVPFNDTVNDIRFHLMNTFFFFPFAIICIAYVGIWCGVKKRTHLRPGHTSDQSIRLTLTVSIVIGLFLVAWLPFFIVRFILEGCQSYCVSWRLFFFTKFLHFSNSGINPVIYGLRIPEYRKFLKQVLHLKHLNFLVNYYSMFETNTFRRQSSRLDTVNGQSIARSNSKLIKTSGV
jgi:hypothetical protein